MKIRKLRYIPGMISLLILPILLIFWGSQEKTRFNAVRMFMLPDMNYVMPNVYEERSLKEKLANKKLVNIYLDREEAAYPAEPEAFLQARKKLFLQKEIEHLVFSHDTSRVLKINMDPSSRYGDFIDVTNLAIIYQLRRYTFIDDAFYLFSSKPPVRYPAIEIPLEPIPMVMNIPPPPSRWQLFKRGMQDEIILLNWFMKPRSNRLLLTGFLLFIAIPTVIYLKRQRRKSLTVTT